VQKYKIISIQQQKAEGKWLLSEFVTMGFVLQDRVHGDSVPAIWALVLDA
jgi:hypothetical protein